MDHNTTRPDNANFVRYRCSCGSELTLDSSVGGICTGCQKQISPKLLGHDLAMTMTIHDGSFELNQTLDRADINHASTTSQSVKIKITDESDDPDVLIGAMYGHFEIVSTLGRGGMGQVYRALDTSLQRYVAVKLLRSGIAGGSSGTLGRSSDGEIDKLLQEAVSQARVTHPNIVTIYYVGKQEGDPFLAMELVNGKPLSGRIADGEMKFEEISQIAMQIAEALKFSHGLDIIHGDIKPSNVLLQHNGVAKLSDFGMATSASLTQDEAIGGTPNYIAPELLRGQSPSIQSDIYALGVTLYEMSFGKLPVTLSGRTIPEWIEIHQQSKLVFPNPWPDHLPEAWAELIGRMLAKNPADRHENYDELISDLTMLSPGAQVSARIFPRIVAWLIDCFSVLILALALQVAVSIETLGANLAAHPMINFMLGMLDFVPLIVFTVCVYFWRQSIGRGLMHVRVVNRHGLPPSRQHMLARSLFRMQFPWIIVFTLLFDSFDQVWLSITMVSLFLISLVVLVLDLAFASFYQRGRSLHDLALDTKVILDTRSTDHRL